MIGTQDGQFRHPVRTNSQPNGMCRQPNKLLTLSDTQSSSQNKCVDT